MYNVEVTGHTHYCVGRYPFFNVVQRYIFILKYLILGMLFFPIYKVSK